MTWLTPEAAALFAAAGPEDRDDDIRGLMGPQFRWDRFLWLAARERVVAVVWRRLEALGIQPPTEIGEAFRRQSMVAGFTAATLEARLRDTLEALHKGGIEPVILKGAALATTVYQGFRDRPMCDIDLLVRVEDAARSRELALAAGWLPVQEFEAADYGQHHHLPPLLDATGAIGLELHTDLFPRGSPFGGVADAVRSRSEPHPSGQGRMPSTVHAALHVCLHLGWSHALSSGAWRAFRDLHCLAASGRVDWDEFRVEAERRRAVSCCYWVLRLARELSGVTTPMDDPAHQLVWEPVGRRALVRHLAAGLDVPERVCPSLALQRTLWRLAIRPGKSGHGERFPWTASVDVDGDDDSYQGAPVGRASGPLGHLWETGRYAVSLVSPFGSARDSGPRPARG